ncbi:FadR family transcriptional regulator [Stappia sp. F7233]|uniref:FadR family transcriptional regulator n=1 Tax=Stappia albiluteola TaxID=2758565 RepID=A0A839AAX5_9HYPH|nr:GntR family transcriptional regulator [Stappia albiluteola]MBA5776184.1 FadR family transcriptional regulator [Stappia albiluteola]
MAVNMVEGALPLDMAPANASAVDSVVHQIRELIADAGLKVGDSLPTERELCAQFSASRNTVREAMRILKAYGLVDVRPKVGATITDNRMSRAFELFSFNTMEVSLKTFSDVQAFRALLEVGSVEQIFDRLVDRDIDDLRRINADLSRIHDMAEASQVDFDFHVRLIAILDNAAILDVYKVMKPIILRIMQKGKTRRTFKTETYSEHEEVIDALSARDRLAFQYRLRGHLMKGFKYFNEEMEASS